jgi:16S rRNA (guanine966-N2)-methyltransferase
VKRAGAAANRVRIIGGEFRGRKLAFVPGHGLRPTADRVRETLFNWLAPEVEGACCLDLFAGSGALGIEALSRGARRVVFLEQGAPVARRLRENLDLLGAAGRAEVRRGEALKSLRVGAPEPFDLVFVDPPFAAGLLGGACEALEEGGWLAPQALVYLEQDAHRDWPELPANWLAWREGKAGQAAFRLMRRGPLPAG